MQVEKKKESKFLSEILIQITGRLPYQIDLRSHAMVDWMVDGGMDY